MIIPLYCSQASVLLRVIFHQNFVDCIKLYRPRFRYTKLSRNSEIIQQSKVAQLLYLRESLCLKRNSALTIKRKGQWIIPGKWITYFENWRKALEDASAWETRCDYLIHDMGKRSAERSLNLEESPDNMKEMKIREKKHLNWCKKDKHHREFISIKEMRMKGPTPSENVEIIKGKKKENRSNPMN